MSCVRCHEEIAEVDRLPEKFKGLEMHRRCLEVGMTSGEPGECLLIEDRAETGRHIRGHIVLDINLDDRETRGLAAAVDKTHDRGMVLAREIAPLFTSASHAAIAFALGYLSFCKMLRWDPLQGIAELVAYLRSIDHPVMRLSETAETTETVS